MIPVECTHCGGVWEGLTTAQAVALLPFHGSGKCEKKAEKS